jgi:hypothetical protein
MNSRSFLFLPFGFATDGNIQNFWQANRRVTNIAACKPSDESPDAESRRSKAATVIKRDVAPADDCCANKVIKISPEQARSNIIAAYKRQHQEGVSALNSAIERVKAPRQTPKQKPFLVLSPRWLRFSWLDAMNKVQTSQSSADTFRPLWGNPRAFFCCSGRSSHRSWLGVCFFLP